MLMFKIPIVRTSKHMWFDGDADPKFSAKQITQQSGNWFTHEEWKDEVLTPNLGVNLGLRHNSLPAPKKTRVQVRCARYRLNVGQEGSGPCQKTPDREQWTRLLLQPSRPSKLSLWKPSADRDQCVNWLAVAERKRRLFFNPYLRTPKNAYTAMCWHLRDGPISF